MHISKVTFYSKINIFLCSLSKCLYFPHADIYDNRPLCLKHGVTLSFSQAYTFPWKEVFAIYPAVHSNGARGSVNSLGRKSGTNIVQRTPVWEGLHLLATRFITTRKPSLRNTGLLIHCLVGSCSIAPSSG